jgi:hypothetical protein
MQLAMAKYLFKVIIAIADTPFIYWARTGQVDKVDWIATPSTKSTDSM